MKRRALFASLAGLATLPFLGFIPKAEAKRTAEELIASLEKNLKDYENAFARSYKVYRPESVRSSGVIKIHNYSNAKIRVVRSAAPVPNLRIDIGDVGPEILIPSR